MQRGRELTFGQARDLYFNRADVRSQHTLDSYSRALDLFFAYLGDRSFPRVLPIQQQHYLTIADIPLSLLTNDDTPVLLHFARWLASPGSEAKGGRRPYKPATVELRLAGVQNWLQFLDDFGYLPAGFNLSKAKRLAKEERIDMEPGNTVSVQLPDGIEAVIYYYDTLPLPAHLRRPTVHPDRVHRWNLTRLRNRALLHALAETGGRISELLGLNLEDFSSEAFEGDSVWRVEVTGKGGHAYDLRFFDSLTAIRAYLEARGADLNGEIPLFISHDPRYDGNRMSRVVAWRIVQRAANALGLPAVTLNDFRHWRAMQLVDAGHSLDLVQEYLGHRSMETIRTYYGNTDPSIIDDVVRHTGLPDPGDT
jgi:integrase